MLVHRDEDVKSEASSNILKETVFAIISIFKSIKQSEDIVDAAKLKVGDKYIMSMFIVNFQLLCLLSIIVPPPNSKKVERIL